MQLFVTTPFIAALGDEAGREFLAVFLFDSNGRFSEARIDDLGPRPAVNHEETQRLLHKRIAELGPIDYGRIEVQPFAIERFVRPSGLFRGPRKGGRLMVGRTATRQLHGFSRALG